MHHICPVGTSTACEPFHTRDCWVSKRGGAVFSLPSELADLISNLQILRNTTETLHRDSEDHSVPVFAMPFSPGCSPSEGSLKLGSAPQAASWHSEEKGYPEKLKNRKVKKACFHCNATPGNLVFGNIILNGQKMQKQFINKVRK